MNILFVAEAAAGPKLWKVALQSLTGLRGEKRGLRLNTGAQAMIVCGENGGFKITIGINLAKK